MKECLINALPHFDTFLRNGAGQHLCADGTSWLLDDDCCAQEQ